MGTGVRRMVEGERRMFDRGNAHLLTNDRSPIIDDDYMMMTRVVV